jgi:hypothetical protein
MENVVGSSFEDRLGEVFKRAGTKLSPEVAAQLNALVNKQSLEIIAGVLVLWVVGHAFGYGEVIDLILSVVGVLSIGLSVFNGLDEFFLFAKGTYSAKVEGDLDEAARHFADAIAILGIQTVLALLFKGRPRGGGRTAVPAGPTNPGLRYRPTITRDPALPAGQGSTSFWGDVEVSIAGSDSDRAVVLLHDRVHQFLAPKFFKLRQFRVENRISSYFRSSLYRYIEEAMAESVAQIGVNGFSKLFVGIRFPVTNGYVYLTRSGGYSRVMAGRGLLQEGSSLLATGVVNSMVFQIRFKSGKLPSASASNSSH